MKKLLVITTLIGTLISCSDRPRPNHNYPKFALDQQVSITGGFFKGHQGVIAAWEADCTDRDTHDPVICYEIISKDDQQNSHVYKPVNEKDLK